MDYVVGLLSLAVSGLAAVVASWLTTVALVIGAGACLFAVHLVRVQPRQARDEAGLSPQAMAMLMAAPLAAAGLAVIIWVLVQRGA